MNIKKNHTSYSLFLESIIMVTGPSFNNCIHTKEPHCAVKEALEEDRVSWSRYKSYLQILSGDEEKEHFRTDIWDEEDNE